MVGRTRIGTCSPLGKANRSAFRSGHSGGAVKTLILAGGSGGLGAVLARLALERGYKPVIGYRANNERAGKLAKELKVPIVAGDIAEESVRAGLIEAARDAGELYGLAVLSGDPARVPIEKASADDLLASM